MSPGRNPQPFGTSIAIRGRPAEVTELVVELLDRLRGLGWEVEGDKRGRSPLRATRLTSGEQWLAVTVASPTPHRLSHAAEYELSVSGVVRDRADLHDLVAALPFTQLELDVLAHDMPLTASVAERAPSWMPGLKLQGRPLAGLGAIFTIHHQTDFVLLLEKALELGVEREMVTVIDKEYRYRHSRRVDAHIRRRLEVPVYRYSEIKKGLSDHIRRVDEARVASGASSWTKTIIVDDGGYVLPLLQESFEPFLNFFLGAVEQTRSGIWKLQPYAEDHRVPIFSVAESDLKATVEAHGVAQAALTCLRGLMPHEKFDGRRAVVVGYGTIGAALADLLRRQRIDVYVADSEDSRLVAAREFGFQVSENLADLIRQVKPRYLFSCAKPGAVGRTELEAIEKDCVLASLTSRDAAFDKEALAAIAKARKLGTVGTLYTDGASASNILLLANGFPLNFHFSESMPNQQSDLVMASLLAGAITLARTTPSWPPGNEPDRANSALNEGSLLHDFLRLEPRLDSEPK